MSPTPNSSSITIPHHSSAPSHPTPRPSTNTRSSHRSVFSTSTSTIASSSSSYSSSPKMREQDHDSSVSPSPSSSPSEPTAQKREKDPSLSSKIVSRHQHRPSLLGPNLSTSSIHRSINLAPPDSPPRLVTFLTSSQGFTWNDELFLPSYHSELSRRKRRYDNGGGGNGGMEEEADKVDVVEIWISEEEARGLVPE